MKLKQLALVGVMMSSGMLGVASQAHALTLSPLTPADADWTSNITSNLDQLQVEDIVKVSPLGLVYKQDEGGGDFGNAKNYYTTAFTYTPEKPGSLEMEPTGATITWVVNTELMAISCGSCFLIVKDGNHTPAQYIFDISAWNGTDTISLNNFWAYPAGGAISNVAIWNIAGPGPGGGGTVAAIPEADTYAMLLAGLGLVGFAARRRLRNLA